jgi:hypothetical protein
MARIAALKDPVLRNLQITQSYWELSEDLREYVPGGANWCTFAVWASKQAGRSIRSEDLARALEKKIGANQPEAVRREISKVAALAPGIRRSAEAVARGNVKVYEEIAPALARFLDAPDEDPPLEDWQGLLREALLSLRNAHAASGADRAQWLLAANLRIGLHEQRRLQGEIQEALDESLVPAESLEDGVYEVLSARLSWTERLWSWFSPYREKLLREAARTLARETARRLRELATARMMSIELAAAGTLKLGEDLRRAYPESLRNPDNAELLELLRQADPVEDSTRESGARDWSDFPERMHFIAELFRCYQEEPSLSAAPYSPTQAGAIWAGRIPAGEL